MTQQINLFNPLFLKQQKYFSAMTMLQAMLVVVLSMAVFYGYQYMQFSKLDLQVKESEQAFEKQKLQLAAVTATLPQTQALTAMEQQSKDLQAAIATRQALLQILSSADAGKSSGYTTYLNALARQVVDGLWLTSVQIGENGSDLEITGRASHPDLIPVLIRKYRVEPALRGRQFESLQVRKVTPAAGPANRGMPPYFEFLISSQAVALLANADRTGRSVAVGQDVLNVVDPSGLPTTETESRRGTAASPVSERSSAQGGRQ